MKWGYVWKLAKRAKFHPKQFIYEARIDALKSIRHEFESHDYFREAGMVQSFINSEPKP